MQLRFHQRGRRAPCDPTHTTCYLKDPMKLHFLVAMCVLNTVAAEQRGPEEEQVCTSD